MLPEDGRPRGRAPHLKDVAKAWPTPKARDSKGPENENRNSPGLEVMAKAWATPTATDATSGGPSDLKPRGNRTGASAIPLQAMAKLHGRQGETTPTDGPPTADLNPSFVEQLMGLPAGWSDPEGSVTGFTSWATAWSRRLARGRSGN